MVAILFVAGALTGIAALASAASTDRLVHQVLAILRAHGPLTRAEILIALDLPDSARRRVAIALDRLVKAARIVRRSEWIYAAVS